MFKDVSKAHFLSQEMLHRYATPFSESTIGTCNLVDSFRPSRDECNVLVEGSLQYFPFANVVPVTESLAYLGYTKNHIQELVTKINKNRYLLDLVFAGMGGMNNGILYWLIQIQKELNINTLRNIALHAFETSTWDISNVPRIHFYPFTEDHYVNKATWVQKIINQEGININVREELITPERLNYFSKHTIVVGATDIDTRKALTECDKILYLQITQNNHMLNIWRNPIIDVKTPDVYGYIFLNEFHLLTLKAAVILLEQLAKFEATPSTYTKEVHVDSFDMQKHADMYDKNNWLGVPKLGYKFSRNNGYNYEVPQSTEEAMSDVIESSSFEHSEPEFIVRPLDITI